MVPEQHLSSLHFPFPATGMDERLEEMTVAQLEDAASMAYYTPDMRFPVKCRMMSGREFIVLVRETITVYELMCNLGDKVDKRGWFVRLYMQHRGEPLLLRPGSILRDYGITNFTELDMVVLQGEEAEEELAEASYEAPARGDED